MKKTIKLTESDLMRLVKRIISEQTDKEFLTYDELVNMKDTETVRKKVETKQKKVQLIKKGECERVVNYNILKTAITWWKTWLNDKVTKNKFAKVFKYDNSTVEKHFGEYNKILDQIKLEYVFSDKPNGGWVDVGFKNGYNIPITINCNIAINYNPESTKSFLIHEIQHILDSYHKFHPYSNNIFTFYKDMFSDLTTNYTKGVKDEEIIKKLTSNGFGSFDINKGVDKDNPFYSKVMSYSYNTKLNIDIFDDTINNYKWRLKNDILHLKDKNELTSTLSQVRSYLELKPKDKITKKMLIDEFKNPVIDTFISQWLFSGKTLDEFLNFNNSIAMGQIKNNNLNLA